MCIEFLKKNQCTIILSGIIFSILIIEFLIIFNLNIYYEFILFVFFAAAAILLCYYVICKVQDVICYEKEEKLLLSGTRNWLSKNALRVMLTVLVILFLALGIPFYYYTSPIAIEPKKFEAKIPAGDSLTETISIKNLAISEEIVWIKTESPDNWVNVSSKNFTINSGQTKNINFSIEIPLNASLGEYRGVIKIIYKNNITTEMPILLTVQPPAQFQAKIEAPDKANKTGYFKTEINIKNIGDSPVYGVRIRINESGTTGLNLSEFKDRVEIIDLLPKNAEFSTVWWFKPNETNKTDWQTIKFDINSTNARNQTIITKVNISG